MDNKTSVNGLFDAMFDDERIPGVKVRKMLRYAEAEAAAREAVSLMARFDDDTGVVIPLALTEGIEVYLFLKYATDYDTSVFLLDNGSLDVAALYDAIAELVGEENLYVINTRAYPCWFRFDRLFKGYYEYLTSQYKREHSLEHKVVNAFGDMLVGDAGETLAKAGGLADTLSVLIDAAKTQNPTGTKVVARDGVISFAKKK